MRSIVKILLRNISLKNGPWVISKVMAIKTLFAEIKLKCHFVTSRGQHKLKVKCSLKLFKAQHYPGPSPCWHYSVLYTCARSILATCGITLLCTDRHWQPQLICFVPSSDKDPASHLDGCSWLYWISVSKCSLPVLYFWEIPTIFGTCKLYHSWSIYITFMFTWIVYTSSPCAPFTHFHMCTLLAKSFNKCSDCCDYECCTQYIRRQELSPCRTFAEA